MSSDTLAPGLQLAGRYTLVRPLGRGGMAAVWEARNQAQQRVAIKMLSAAFAENPELVARFFLEARAATSIAHPGIVRVLDTGQTPWGAPFLVMEELIGLSLAELLERHGRFSPSQAVTVLAPVLDAVAAAHAAGVIHRDLKPGNVFVTQSSVKLLDFGISKVITADARLTQTGMVFGTPAYMSPEQVRDAKEATVASDVYSVGVLAFELLAGAPPFDAENPFALAARVLNEEPPALEQLRPELPAGLCRLIHRALAKDPSQRPARAHLFKEQLEAQVPPDPAWLFARVGQLLEETGSKATEVPDAPGTAPKPARKAGAELSLAQLFDRLARTGRRMPPGVAARLAYDLLLDPSTPPTLTPAQVMIASDGHVRAVPGAGLKSQRGARLQSWVAPEAWDAHASALSLQFSLGAVLLQAITGEAPFEAEDEAKLRARLRAGVQRATWAKVPAEMPPAVGPVLERMVAADPLHRYPDAGTCAGELAAPFRASPHFSRATEELAALCRAAALPGATKQEAAAPPPVQGSGISGLGALLVAVLALGGGIGIGVWRLREQAQRVVDQQPEPPREVTTGPVEPAEDPSIAPLVEAPRAPSEYQVTSEPPGAALWLDGVFNGNAPGRLTLPQGKIFALHLELPGHRAVNQEIVADGKPHPLKVKLTSDKTLGTVRFDVADETRIWLDGVLVAQGRVALPVEANVEHHFQLEVNGARSPMQVVRVLTAEVKTLQLE